MSDYQITVQPAYSCPIFTTLEWLKLPQNLSLYWHQLETLKAIRDPDIDIILNYGVPNSGKSLAAYLNTLQGGNSALGLYPNQKSVKEQEKRIDKYLKQFKLEKNIVINCTTVNEV